LLPNLFYLYGRFRSAMQTIISLYRNAYAGLSRPAWMLAVVMFINRSGAMVVPFLSVYLTEHLHFSLKQVGVVLSLFGLGSLGGSFAGGYLTDRLGHFRVQLWSLTLGGGLFFLMAQLKDFMSFAAGIFILSLVAESLRPANSSSVTFYARPENLTRAFSLNRMAINLGFSIGPVLAGLLATVSYKWLFYGDGISCLAAGLFFFFYFRNRPGYLPELQQANSPLPATRSPYRDLRFVGFVLLSSCFALTFFQFFSTLPLFYRQVHQLSEAQMGLLLALNGLVVFSLEMILVYLIGTRIKPAVLITAGTLLVGLSLVLLNLVSGQWILYVSMIILSLAEILAMPYMATIPVNRSQEQNRGRYMGFYNLSFSASFILGPFLGISLIDRYGFDTLWWAGGLLAWLTAIGFYLLVKKL
jgi:predicted MFS family arabinose efflux permease